MVRGNDGVAEERIGREKPAQDRRRDYRIAIRMIDEDGGFTVEAAALVDIVDGQSSTRYGLVEARVFSVVIDIQECAPAESRLPSPRFCVPVLGPFDVAIRDTKAWRI